MSRGGTRPHSRESDENDPGGKHCGPRTTARRPIEAVPGARLGAGPVRPAREMNENYFNRPIVVASTLYVRATSACVSPAARREIASCR
jgi:hypothetical protein